MNEELTKLEEKLDKNINELHEAIYGIAYKNACVIDKKVDTLSKEFLEISNRALECTNICNELLKNR